MPQEDNARLSTPTTHFWACLVYCIWEVFPEQESLPSSVRCRNVSRNSQPFSSAEELTGVTLKLGGGNPTEPRSINRKNGNEGMKDDGCSKEQLVLTKAEKKTPETSISKRSGIINKDTKACRE